MKRRERSHIFFFSLLFCWILSLHLPLTCKASEALIDVNRLPESLVDDNHSLHMSGQLKGDLDLEQKNAFDTELSGIQAGTIRWSNSLLQHFAIDQSSQIQALSFNLSRIERSSLTESSFGNLTLSNSISMALDFTHLSLDKMNLENTTITASNWTHVAGRVVRTRQSTFSELTIAGDSIAEWESTNDNWETATLRQLSLENLAFSEAHVGHLVVSEVQNTAKGQWQILASKIEWLGFDSIRISGLYFDQTQVFGGQFLNSGLQNLTVSKAIFSSDLINTKISQAEFRDSSFINVRSIGSSIDIASFDNVDFRASNLSDLVITNRVVFHNCRYDRATLLPALSPEQLNGLKLIP